jgi:hypothetical protein
MTWFEELGAELMAGLPGQLGAPRPPSPDAPSGLIWPPVDGRLILHRIADLGLRTRVTSIGDCVAGLGSGWRVHSRASARFGDLEEGRSALIGWARQHAATGRLLSRPRCIVLSETGDGQWRLWQIVAAERSLRELLSSRIEDLDPDEAARELAEAARLLCESQRLCGQARLPVSCTLDTIGRGEGDAPIYVGLMPSGEEQAPRPSDPAGLARDLAPIVVTGLPGRRAEVAAAILSMRSTVFAFSAHRRRPPWRPAAGRQQRRGSTRRLPPGAGPRAAPRRPPSIRAARPPPPRVPPPPRGGAAATRARRGVDARGRSPGPRTGWSPSREDSDGTEGIARDCRDGPAVVSRYPSPHPSGVT